MSLTIALFAVVLECTTARPEAEATAKAFIPPHLPFPHHGLLHPHEGILPGPIFPPLIHTGAIPSHPVVYEAPEIHVENSHGVVYKPPRVHIEESHNIYTPLKDHVTKSHKVSHHVSQKSHHAADHYAHPKYEFGYGVYDAYSGNNFGHSERRDGHKTEGQYHVQLPDGRLQKVSYYADEWGYHPTITYE